MDANFRLKRKDVSKDSVDPSFSQGWSFFVEEKPYKEYLCNQANICQEVSGHCWYSKTHLNVCQRSTCVGHNAVNAADTKSSKGLAATGSGTIDCTQHGMKLPGGVGDLQKGERYASCHHLA